MEQKKDEKETITMLLVRFGKNRPRKSVGLRPGVEGEDFGVIFGVFECKSENYKYGDTVKQEDVGKPIIGFTFDDVLDWKNFVNIVNHQDKKLDEYLKDKETEL